MTRCAHSIHTARAVPESSDGTVTLPDDCPKRNWILVKNYTHSTACRYTAAVRANVYVYTYYYYYYYYYIVRVYTYKCVHILWILIIFERRGERDRKKTLIQTPDVVAEPSHKTNFLTAGQHTYTRLGLHFNIPRAITSGRDAGKRKRKNEREREIEIDQLTNLNNHKPNGRCVAKTALRSLENKLNHNNNNHVTKV